MMETGKSEYSSQNTNGANQVYEHIPAEKFAFAQMDTEIRDTKLQTKSRGYFADAMIRFKKNKSSGGGLDHRATGGVRRAGTCHIPLQYQEG